MSAQEQSDLANARLAELYRPLLESWRKLRNSNSGISIPMFLKATPAYFAAKPRVIVVGQETHGWMTDCKIGYEKVSVQQIMDFYLGVEITTFRQQTRSPYWRAIRKVAGEIGIQDYCYGLMTANLFPCDSDKGQAPEVLLQTMREWGVLPKEVEILQPEIVIFFCGPVYSYNLGFYFGKELLPPLSSQSRLQPYKPENVSWTGWATYHPNNLLRSGSSAVLEQLVSLIQEGTSARKPEQAEGLSHP